MSWRVVLKKELIDSARDRRSVASLLLFPVIGPVLVSAMLTQVVERATSEHTIDLPVAGAERAPGLVDYLKEQGIHVIAAPADPDGAVRDGTAHAVLVIEPDYRAHLRAGRTAHVELIVDDARERGQSSVRRVRAALDRYAATVGSLRQLARGQSPAPAVSVDEVDLSTPEARSAVFLNFIPMFVLLAAFVGGMHTASDATAGERERGSLEPLLLTPATRRALALGKWLAAVAFSAASIVTTLTLTVVALGRVPLGRFGMTAALDARHAGLVLITVLPVAPLACGAQLFVASFARTVKEAQIYMSLFVLAPMIPGMLLAFDPMKTKPWMTLVPVFGQQAILAGLIRGEPQPAAGFVLAAAVAVVLGAAFALATAALFRRERIVYGR